MANRAGLASKRLLNIAFILAIGITVWFFFQAGFLVLVVMYFGSYWELHLIWLIVLLFCHIAAIVIIRKKSLVTGIMIVIFGIAIPAYFRELMSGDGYLLLVGLTYLLCGGLAIAYWWGTRKGKGQLEAGS